MSQLLLLRDAKRPLSGFHYQANKLKKKVAGQHTFKGGRGGEMTKNCENVFLKSLYIKARICKN